MIDGKEVEFAGGFYGHRALLDGAAVTEEPSRIKDQACRSTAAAVEKNMTTCRS
jgi:hypothetical protein